MSGVAEIARALGGEVVRVSGVEGARVPGIGHSPGDRSVSIRLDPLRVHCFGGGDWKAEQERVRKLLGGSKDRRKAASAPRPKLAPPKPNLTALWIWSEAFHPWGTRVERYLNKRGLFLPEYAAGAAIRSDHHCKFRWETVPAMLGLVRNIATDRPQAIHRTALSWADGNYAVGGDKRLCLGPVAGGAIKLTPQEMMADELGIAEGIETALSLLYLERPPRAGWSLISASGIATFPVLPRIRRLIIAVDHDAAGEAAAETCARRWTRAGREVVLHKPVAAGADLNDLAQGEAS